MGVKTTTANTEVQAMYFEASREFASIHDEVIYMNGTTKTLASISNLPRHDAVSIWTHKRLTFK